MWCWEGGKGSYQFGRCGPVQLHTEKKGQLLFPIQQQDPQPDNV